MLRLNYVKIALLRIKRLIIKKVRVEVDDKSKLTNIIKDIFIPRAGKGAGKSRKR